MANEKMEKKGEQAHVAEPAGLLAELRSSQAAVAGDVGKLSQGVADVNAALAAVLSQAKEATAEVGAEKLAALHAIQVQLEVALTIIRAVSKYPVDAEEFQGEDDKGGPLQP